MDVEEINLMFGGKLVGTKRMQRLVCEAVSLLPQESIEFITQNCWFLSSLSDAWAFTFTGNDLRDQHLIFLSDELLVQDYEQIQFTIIHEIGHVILGHRNATLSHQSKSEIQKQEQEADAFAEKFI